MALMTYASLTGNKSTAGSIKRDVNYEQLDPEQIVEEAESLIYDTLRVREMRATWTFAMAIGAYQIALVDNFLDPIGRLRDSSNFRYIQRSEDELLKSRVWSQSTGSLGTDPFSVASGDETVTVTHTSHGLEVGDVVKFEGATAGGGITVDGAYVVATVTDANTYTIEHSDSATSDDSTTGGSAVTYTYETLDDGQPTFWSIMDEMVQFDIRFDENRMLYLPYYKQPAALSASGTNFLTSRYPHILRTATRVRAHTWMKNWAGVNAEMGILTGAIASANARADLSYRGGDYDQELP